MNVYRLGPKFEVTGVAQLPALLPAYVNNQYEVVTDVGKKLSNMKAACPVESSDSYGFGLAVQPTNALAFTVDIICIEYEDRIERFRYRFRCRRRLERL